MAAVTHGVSTASTTNGTSYTSGAFTPAASDLLVCFVTVPASVLVNPTLTDSQGLGWHLVEWATKATNADRTYCFVAKQLAANSSMTVTFDCTGDGAAGCIIQVARVSGMTRTGISAVRQSMVKNNSAAGTPSISFVKAALTGNPTLGVISSASNPAAMTAPTSWTERDDTGFATPTTGAEYVSRDSGFTSTAIAWGNSTGTAYCGIIIELDASAVSDTGLVQYATKIGAAGTSGVISFPANVTVGNKIIVASNDNNGAVNTISSITDSLGNTYARAVSDTEASFVDGEVWVAPITTGGACTITVTYSATVDWGLAVVEYSGLMASPVDKTQKGHSTTGTALSSGATATTSQADELVLGFGMGNANQSYRLVAGSGFQNQIQLEQESTGIAIAVMDKLVSATGAQTAAMTGTASGHWVCLVVTLKRGSSVSTLSTTKGLAYKIKRTPSALTKGLIYRIKKTIPLTKTLTYRIKRAPAAATKALTYRIKRTPTALTKGLTYRIKRTPTALTKGLTYRIKKPIPATKTLEYRVKAPRPATKQLRYAVKRTPSAVTKGLVYRVAPHVSVTKQLQYQVKAPAAATKQLTYRVTAPHAITKGLTYRIRAQHAAATKGLTYRIRITPTAVAKGLAYAIKASPALTKQLQYSIKAPVALTKGLTYRVRTQIAAVTKGLVYRIKVLRPTTKSLAYRVLTATTVTKGLTYKIRTVPVATKGLQYRIKAATPLTKGLQYRIKTPHPATKTLQYAIRTSPAALTKSLSYDVVVPAGTTKPMAYRVKAARLINKGLVYQIESQAVLLTKSLTYHVSLSRAMTKGMAYDVRASQTLAKGLTYAVRQIRPLSLAMRYTVRQERPTTKLLRYTIRRLTVVTKQLRYVIGDVRTARPAPPTVIRVKSDDTRLKDSPKATVSIRNTETATVIRVRPGATLNIRIRPADSTRLRDSRDATNVFIRNGETILKPRRK